MKEITKFDLTSVSITERGTEVDGYIKEIKDKSIQSLGIPQDILKECNTFSFLDKNKIIICQEDDGDEIG
jgi:hypothetical protein